MKTKVRLFLLFWGMLLLTTRVFSQDPNFHIYICFGQSNMEGQGTIENQDKTVDSRFRVMEAIDCSSLGRTMGSWYTAIPPLTRCYSGLSPSDYFGRTMVANLASNIRVGIINVSVAGCKIELFDKYNYPAYVATVPQWMKDIINAYGGNPYARLVQIAKLAQKDGVIKGILLHQGESNTGDNQWPSKVKGVYNNLIADLGLSASLVPLLAGEVVNADQGGACASMNSIIATLPQTLPNSYAISSSGCTCVSDKLHFTSAGYREIGKRYAAKMLSLLGSQPPASQGISLEAECGTVGSLFNVTTDANASNKTYATVKSDNNSAASAPASAAGWISLPFTINQTGTYSIWARTICPDADGDSYWLKMDNGSFAMWNGITTSTSWTWTKYPNTFNLTTTGNHTLTIGYREDGAKLDKIYITSAGDTPNGAGTAASNLCTPVLKSATDLANDDDNYSKGIYIYPNPVSSSLNVALSGSPSEISLYNIDNQQLLNLNTENTNVTINMAKYLPGIYFLKITNSDRTITEKIIKQ